MIFVVLSSKFAVFHQYLVILSPVYRHSIVILSTHFAAMQLSFRLRLMIGYAGIVMLTVTVFGVVFYATVFGDLNSNLDSSMQRVAESLDNIIKQKQRETRQPLRPAADSRNRLAARKNKKTAKTNYPAYAGYHDYRDYHDYSDYPDYTDYFTFLREQSRRRFVGPVLPLKDTAQQAAAQAAAQADVVWSAVYERILFDPKNYFIQVADTGGAIVWRSENLMNFNRALPLPSDGMLAGDVLPFRTTLPRYPFTSRVVSRAGSQTGSQTVSQALRLYVYRTSTVQISIGYPVNEIETTLADLFSTLVMTIPFVLAASLIGGWLLARYFVQPVEAITQTAHEITANNLSQRIPVRQVNDEITRLAETLNQMISRLEDSFKQIRQFTGDASHELRTPLAILMGELEIALRSEKSNEEYQDVIMSALEEVNRLSQVVQNLLDLSRADSGQVQILWEPVNLSAMMEDIYEDALILAEEYEHRIEFQRASDGSENPSENPSEDPSEPSRKPLIVLGDKVRIHEAILNVVDNAIKYTPRGGRIMLILEQELEQGLEQGLKQKQDGDTSDGDRVLVAVSDTGVGIAADDVPYIFDRFYRVDKARAKAEEVGGHGLGLSIVKWIVEAHDGSIHVQSNVGKGTTFFLRFPVQRKAQSAISEM